MESFWQFVRYGVVGVCSNGLIYLAYLGLTWLGMGHKTAMSLLYAVAVLLTYAANRLWTFRSKAPVTGSMVRYFGAYGFGYVFMLVAMLIMVDTLGLPHRAVYLALILVTAVGLFLLQKFWVFPTSDPSRASELR